MTARLFRCIKEALADRRGSVSVLAALMLPIVVAGIALGAETGVWYYKQRALQNAADVAVHAAAVRKRSGADLSDMQASALHIARESGFAGADTGFVTNSPATAGALAGDASSVEVVVAEVQPRLLSAIFDDTPLTLSARAVAKISEGSKACILALAPTASGAVTVWGSTTVTLEGCDVASDSNAPDAFSMGGSGQLSADCIYSVGGAVTTAGLTLSVCDAIRENAAVIADPYRYVAEPANQGTCNGKNVGNTHGITTLTPVENHPSGVKAMRFCGGLSIKGDTTFEPGLYIIDGGDFTVNGSMAQLIGSGVTFYLTGGAQLKLTGNASLNLSAPTTGPFAGILFFGGRDQTGIDHTLAGTSDSVLQGAVYTPASGITYRGNSATTDACTQIVAYTVELSGNSSLGSQCEAIGGRDIVSSAAITLVE
ncbi:pilus assembly protein TadG-related protein [Jiella sp. M17.18]|uniref:pilus assembly protein TadG-related protein n=1 Tax=Jiella sp. M17.18 TaxID=3234247 RepID=UPI0034DF262E